MPQDSSIHSLTLTSQDWDHISRLAADLSIPSSRRARAHTLLLMRDRVEDTFIENRTGIPPTAQRALLRTLRTSGLDQAISGTQRKARSSKFPIALLVKTLRTILESRPPEGSTRWDLRKLTLALREQVPAAETISTESVRTLLREQLGITSIRQVDPFWLLQLKRMKANEDAQT